MILPSHPNDTAYPWHEDHHRIWCFHMARKKPGFGVDWSLEGSLNDLTLPAEGEDPAFAARRRAYAFAIGMMPGATDMLLLAPVGQAIFIEQKKRPFGQLTPEQTDRIRFLSRIGFKKIYLPRSRTPAEAWEKLERIIDRYNRQPLLRCFW